MLVGPQLQPNKGPGQGTLGSRLTGKSFKKVSMMCQELRTEVAFDTRERSLVTGYLGIEGDIGFRRRSQVAV